MFSPSFTGTIIILFFDFNCLNCLTLVHSSGIVPRIAGAKVLLFRETAKFFANFSHLQPPKGPHREKSRPHRGKSRPFFELTANGTQRRKDTKNCAQREKTLCLCVFAYHKTIPTCFFYTYKKTISDSRGCRGSAPWSRCGWRLRWRSSPRDPWPRWCSWSSCLSPCCLPRFPGWWQRWR